MSKEITINILRAFVNEKGEYGNTTGSIVDDEQALSIEVRQKIATSLHYTDTVFINSLDPVTISFFNPQQETKFAGDALISNAYFIRHVLGKDVEVIVCQGGRVKTWEGGELTWIEASLEGTPPWNHKQLDNPSMVDNITQDEASKFEHTMVWAWANEEKGIIRSRTFLPDWGTLEDQGNGSGSMQLAHMLGRRIEIHQGLGSIIFADYAGYNMARVGGKVRVDSERLMSIS